MAGGDEAAGIPEDGIFLVARMRGGDLYSDAGKDSSQKLMELRNMKSHPFDLGISANLLYGFERFNLQSVRRVS
jgi:hypothetical protein